MAGGTKEGGKNKKIGRHSRAPSNRMQDKRTEKNKSKRLQPVHVPENPHDPPVDKSGRYRWAEIIFHGKVERIRCL